MIISEIEMYELLREKMDQREAKTLVEYIESRVEHKFEHAKSVFPEKEDFYRMELKIAEGREETTKKIAELKEETTKKMAEIHLKIVECNTKIAESKNDLIKWLFGLIIGSTTAIIGVMLSIFKVI